MTRPKRLRHEPLDDHIARQAAARYALMREFGLDEPDVADTIIAVYLDPDEDLEHMLSAPVIDDSHA